MLLPTLKMRGSPRSLNEVTRFVINQATFLRDHLILFILVELFETVSVSHELLFKLLVVQHLLITFFNHSCPLHAKCHRRTIVCFRSFPALKLYDRRLLLLMSVQLRIVTVFLRPL